MTRRSLLALLVFVGLGAAGPGTASAGAATTDRADLTVTRINYPGNGIEIARTSGDQRKLEGTSRSFKKFVKARLDVLFEEAGSKPRCAASPTVVVDRYHSGGFASAGEGWYGDCPAGGYSVIYEKSDAGWQQILGTQEARFCQDLAWWGVPRFVGGRTCMAENFKEVRYRPAEATIDSPTASARRVLSVSNGNPIVPADEVLSPAATEQLAVVIARKGYLSLDDCFTAGDSGPIAENLGDAPYGCAVTAKYKREKVESIMLRMSDDFVVTELFEF